MSGIFNASIFNNAAFNTGASGAAVVPDVKTGTGGIDPGEGAKRRSIVKPLGTLGLPKKKGKVAGTVEARVEESRSIQAEIASRLAKEFTEESAAIETRAVTEMTMREVEVEIGVLLKKKLRTEEDDVMLLLLMTAADI